MIRADIETEVSPIVGSEKQSEEMIHYLLQEFEGDTAKIWQSNIFGKSFHELVGEDLNAKVKRMPRTPGRSCGRPSSGSSTRAPGGSSASFYRARLDRQNTTSAGIELLFYPGTRLSKKSRTFLTACKNAVTFAPLCGAKVLASLTGILAQQGFRGI